MMRVMQYEHCPLELYGTSTVGERGQIVVPAEARHALGIVPGDKLLILKHERGPGLILFKIDAARQVLEGLLAVLEDAERQPKEGS